MDYVSVIDGIFSQFSGPKFSIRFWNGVEKSYGTAGDNAFTLVLADELVARRLITQGALGFGEAYMDGSLSIEGDIEAYLRLRHQFKHVRVSWRLAAARMLAALTTPHARKNQIAQHYDLGNDFFSLFLDQETMSYSAALFEGAHDSLDRAQQRKLKYVCDSLGLPRDAHVLDLGGGWGGFMLHAARDWGWKVTGYTLSSAQLAYCRKLVQEEGLEKRVSLEYRDMLSPLPKEAFDAVVSIESIEHVGKERLPAFFKELARTVKPGGPVYIQATGRYMPRAVDPWTLKYVFPGGYLPAKQELLDAAAAAGLVVEGFRDDTDDYVRTMAIWIERLEAKQSVIEEMFGPSFFRLWKLWMHGAKAAFEVRSMSLFRIQLRRHTEGVEA